MSMNSRGDFLSRHDDALRWFTQNKKLHREQARRSGMCSRCTVRRARPGKAYCQRCTEYAGRHARRRAYREAMSMARYGDGFNPFRDKVARIGG